MMRILFVCLLVSGYNGDSSSLYKRSHHQPDWLAHCWDDNPNHIKDPFCDLLTKATTPTTTPAPITTTTEPTTTTTEATTTTTGATTTTTGLPPTTTQSLCYYDVYNETDITATDFSTDLTLLDNANITLNETILFVPQGLDFCQSVCLQSVVQNECQAFEYNDVEASCKLYYYTQPLQIVTNSSNNATTLFLKRCAKEATTTTTEVPTTTTAELTTTTTGLPPTTTERQCFYDVYNETDITATDFGMTLIDNANTTLNGTNAIAHMEQGADFCQKVCLNSVASDNECRAFTYSEEDSCQLYYHTQPLQKVTDGYNNETQLFIKRCSDDPVRTTKAPTTTEAPVATTQLVVVTGTPEPVATTQEPSVQNVTQLVVVNTTEIINTTQIITATTMITIINGTVTNAPPALVTTNMGTGAPPVMTAAASTSAGPNPNQGPGGVVALSSTRFQISGPPSPLPDACLFQNQTFAKGTHWNESCRFDCECVDPDTNTKLCEDMCPEIKDVSATCTIVQEAGQCCPHVDCNNTAVINATGIETGSGNSSDCRDMVDTCDYYDDNACIGLYETWARAHCALRCGYCDYQPRCFDRITYCSLYELDTACTDYRGWARHNCKRACGICI